MNRYKYKEYTVSVPNYYVSIQPDAMEDDNYAEYRFNFRRNPKTGKEKCNRVRIGKLSHKDQTKMYPNDNYFYYIRNCNIKFLIERDSQKLYANMDILSNLSDVTEDSSEIKSLKKIAGKALSDIRDLEDLCEDILGKLEEKEEL